MRGREKESHHNIKIGPNITAESALFHYFFYCLEGLNKAPLLFTFTGWVWQWEKESGGLSKFTDFPHEFPQERAKQIFRLAQLYSLMPDSPSECELSAYTRTELRLVFVQSSMYSLSEVRLHVFLSSFPKAYYYI